VEGAALTVVAEYREQENNIRKQVGKGKAIPLQARTGRESSRKLRLLDFKTINT
jgi:hypothetical protein